MGSLEKLYEGQFSPSPEIVGRGEAARGKLFKLLQKQRGQMSGEEYQRKLGKLEKLGPMETHYQYMARTRDYHYWDKAPFVDREEELKAIMSG